MLRPSQGRVALRGCALTPPIACVAKTGKIGVVEALEMQGSAQG